ncbi:lysophospholipase L1-like esterase [Pontibacter mucosus]|uniref:Lysophospholipase L1-like esterase n=1 Tax=Pontibacter mucosus TaxID=1649266 RepID=A0A2T5YHU7_9BACT|nr:GDSL-type esterase/lipase family protein [Pontibacter mucosus]PTX18878.1 lysophospholipase L1-like esterase [Pontibacter mucosus]
MSQLKYIVLLLFFAILSGTASAQCIILNKGVPGHNTRDLLQRVEQDVLAEQPDLVIMMVGTNDMVNSHKLVDYREYKENYLTLIRKIKARGAELVLLAPPPVDTGYVLGRHDRRLYAEDLNVKVEKAGAIVRALAEENNLHFIDLNTLFKATGSPNREAQSLLINEKNLGKPDGIHPTKEGYELMAKTIYTYLEEKKLLKGKKKIVCFGDSMTYGSYMAGAGTAQGDTYPALLSSMINREQP